MKMYEEEVNRYSVHTGVQWTRPRPVRVWPHMSSRYVYEANTRPAIGE
jgi:hypothetical protein